MAEVSYTNQQAVTDTDAGATDRAAFTNNIKADFSFTKTDENGETPLEGAVFGLYQLTCTDSGHNHLKQLIQVDQQGQVIGSDEECWTQVGRGSVSDQDGTVVFSGLLPSTGQYRLVEYKAPEAISFQKGSGISPGIQLTAHLYSVKTAELKIHRQWMEIRKRDTS